MSKMTPEQEAAYALEWDLGRDGLSRAVQLEYDRLKREREAPKAARRAAAEASRLEIGEAARHAVAEAVTHAGRPKVVPISTTDTLPPALGGDREIKHMRLVEVWGYDSPVEAEDALKNWVLENDYDAVLGVRLLGISNVTGNTNAGIGGGSYGSTQTQFSWALYGTAISWEKQASE